MLEEVPPSLITENVLFSVFGVLGKANDTVFLFPDMLRARAGEVRAAIYVPQRVADSIAQIDLNEGVAAIVTGRLDHTTDQQGLVSRSFKQIVLIRIARVSETYPSELVFPKEPK